jgi:hypothetical protein
MRSLGFSLLFLGLVPSLDAWSDALDVDVSELCRTQIEPQVEGLDCSTIPPYEIESPGPPGDGKTWKIRFYFGFSRTHYSPTDMSIHTPSMNVVVRDFRMVERTSAGYYNPANWGQPLDALRWIDEPTNTFNLSFEKGDHVIYITAYHPKYLQSFDFTPENPTTGDPASISAVGNSNPPIPLGSSRINFLNTYQNMVWQVGYGHKFQLFQSKNSGHLYYIPKADLGVSIGLSRTSVLNPDGVLKEYEGKLGYQGWDASIGHRLEYDQGRVSVFIDQRMIYSHRHHEFLDGTADYNLRLTPITVGIGVDLFPHHRRNSP